MLFRSNYLLKLRASNKDAVEDYAKKYGVEFFPGKKPWEVKVDVAIPSATQNEIYVEDAKTLVENGCVAVCEAANMPTTIEAYHVFKDAGILFGPAKAANAGGVATSGLEMSQDSMRLPWSSEEVDRRLHEIMVRIHNTCRTTANRFGTPGNLVDGANIAGFLKVADAMLDQGLV